MASPGRSPTSAFSETPYLDPSFEKQLEAHTLRTYGDGEEYVRIYSLTKWLRTTAPETGLTPLFRILQNVYRGRGINYDTVIKPDKEWKRVDIVFCILLKIGQPQFVTKFQHAGIVDRELPMSRADMVDKLYKQKVADIKKMSDNDINILAAEFYKLQWMFKPHVFCIDDPNLDYKAVLPIRSKQALGRETNGRAKEKKGGTAHVYRITVLEEFVDKEIRDSLHESCYYDDTSDEELGPVKVCQLVVKEYTNDSDNAEALRAWNNEKAIFERFKGSKVKGVVNYFGSFTKWIRPESDTGDESPGLEKSARRNPAKAKLFILLELAEYDMSDFLKNKSRLTLPAQIKSFWINLFRLADALAELHQYSVKFEGITINNRALHADIKPSNIVSVQGRWKLADMGYARMMGTNETIQIYGYTHNWGAPEVHPGRDSRKPVSTAIDMWSLGCILSVAATWLVLGADEVKVYDQVRVNSTMLRKAKLPEKQSPGNYFHDGSDPLPEISQWHNLLKACLCIGDFMTADVIDLVEKELLVADPEKRATAHKFSRLCQDLERKWASRAREHLSIDPVILAAFKDYNERKTEYGMLDGISEPFNDERHTSPEAKKMAALGKEKAIHIKKDEANKFFENAIQAASLEAEVNKVIECIEESKQADEVALQDRKPSKLRLDTAVATDLHLGATQSYRAVSPASYRLLRSEKRRPLQPENVFQARAAHRRQKDKMWNGKPEFASREEKLKQKYKNRDIIFLLDNSESMSEYWAEARDLLKVLLRKCHKYDDDGVEVLFTGNAEVRLCGKKVDHLIHSIDSGRYDPRNYSVNIATRLDQIFREYEDPKRRATKKWRPSSGALTKKSDHSPKPATLIFFTDGMWRGCDKVDVSNTIKEFLQRIQPDLKTTDTRPFTIEFVHFGEEAEAALYLDYLDDRLCNEDDGMLDVIDTEPAREDVYKMLLGSLDPRYDRLDQGIADDESEQGESLKGGGAVFINSTASPLPTKVPAGSKRKRGLFSRCRAAMAILFDGDTSQESVSNANKPNEQMERTSTSQTHEQVSVAYLQAGAGSKSSDDAVQLAQSNIEQPAIKVNGTDPRATERPPGSSAEP
ncbi:uncharacterized protein PV09_05972 [Verruconis gallopava]|uniref:Protein kinase domain-containing protein n=1 Tax=Verruconis gallopava TaxID=253628 RepID=A0A0D1XKS2_9PEZI|nr:uncharacterized protein PV09_05972 [Verruconis gallopava]KIW02926.1 hypothetical protein PV09_05972 [Verruconis gallopava]